MNNFLLKSRKVSILLFLWLISIGCVDGVTDERNTISDPSSDFMEYTNLSWPEGATVIFSGNPRAFNGDSEFFVVFATDEDTINKFLRNPAPFSDSWEKGPVPNELAFNPDFGYDEYDRSVPIVGKDPEHYEVFTSEKIYFSARARTPSKQNGEVIVIDPRSNKVWLSIWDF